MSKRGVVRACRPCSKKYAQWICRHCNARCCMHRCTDKDPRDGSACCQKCWRKGADFKPAR